MPLILGTDIKNKIDIPYQKHLPKQNVSAGEETIIIVSENNEIELFKKAPKIFITYENVMLVQIEPYIFSIEVSDKIKKMYLDEKKFILAIIDKKKRTVAGYEISKIIVEL